MLSLIKSSLNVTRRVETVKFFHAGRMSQGFEDFFDKKVPNEAYITGRGWTLADVRRKDFDDLHRLWFILYKERNLLLTDKQKASKNQRPIIALDEERYRKVKRSMAAIKHCLGERQKINDKLRKEANSKPKTIPTPTNSSLETPANL